MESIHVCTWKHAELNKLLNSDLFMFCMSCVFILISVIFRLATICQGLKDLIDGMFVCFRVTFSN